MKRPVPLAMLGVMAIVAGAVMMLIGVAMLRGASTFNALSVTVLGLLVCVGGIEMSRLKRSGGPIFWVAALVAAVASAVAGQVDRDYMGVAVIACWGALYQKWRAELMAKTRAAAEDRTARV